MKFITLVSTLAVVASAAFGLTINTPANVVECEPTQLAWSGGTAPYYLTLVPAGQPTAPAIETFPTQNGTSYTWNVDLQSGVSFNIALKDSTGAIAYSDIVTVTAGSSTSCANPSVSASGASATGGSGTSAAGSTASAGTTPGATSASAKTSATTTASGSSSTQSSAAGRLSVSSAFGVAGVMGLVGAALF